MLATATTFVTYCVLVPVIELFGASALPRSIDPGHPAAVGSFACGPRAALVLSRLCGHSLEWSDLPSPSGGVSLHWIQTFLEQHGFPTETRRLNPTDLVTLRTPAIAFISPEYAGGLGHFVVVLDASIGGVHVIDPAAGAQYYWGWRSFSDAWTGYVILPKQNRSTERIALLFSSCCNAALLFVTYCHR